MEAVNEVEGFVSAGQEEIVRLLLDHGAVVGRTNERGWTALHFGVGATTAAIRMLIRAGADVNARSLHGDTPLHQAVERGAVEVTELLVRAGASLTAVNIGGHTPADNFHPGGLTPEEIARFRALLDQPD